MEWDTTGVTYNMLYSCYVWHVASFLLML